MFKKLMWIIGAAALVALVLVIVLFAVPREEPVVEEPVVEEPVVEEPVVEEPVVEEPVVEEPVVVEFRQSPFLDRMDLPPVAERLPKEPKLTNEMPPELLDKEIGRFGGTMRLVTNEVDWNPDIFVALNEPLVNTPAHLGKEVTGNVLKGYEMSPDAMQFTFFLREGLRWSDGQPVTIEDVRFAIEDVLFNEELTPMLPLHLRSGSVSEGTPMRFEIVDDWTFRITFDRPYGGFPLVLATHGWRGYTEFLKPAHYLKQFHVEHTPLEQLEPFIAEEGFEPGEWTRLFHLRDIINMEHTNRLAIGFPALTPWVLVEEIGGVKTVFERNPFYFKVDAAGNQLPYIDRLESHLVEDMEMVLMRILGGEVDFNREDAALVNMPMYRENEAAGGFRALMAPMHNNPTDIHLNMTHADPVWREVVRDVRFRRALSLALDREEIIEAIYFGFAEPTAMQDPTFDLEEANRLLDEMGMIIGADGFRVGPDGGRFTIPIEIAEFAPDMSPLAALMVEMWGELNLDVTMMMLDTGLWGTRNAANELKATLMWTPTPLWTRGEFGQALWGPLWNRWRLTGGAEGEEPPAEVKEFYGLLARLMTTSVEEAATEVLPLIRESMRENLWYFIHIENVKQPLIVNAKLGNVSDKGFAIAANFSMEQMFFRE